MLMVRITPNQTGSKPAAVMIGSRIGAGHQDDGGRRDEEAAHQQEEVDQPHQHPAIEVRVGDRLRQRLGEIERGEHVAEQHGGGDDRQDHHRLAHGVAQDRATIWSGFHSR